MRGGGGGGGGVLYSTTSLSGAVYTALLLSVYSASQSDDHRVSIAHLLLVIGWNWCERCNEVPKVPAAGGLIYL